MSPREMLRTRQVLPVVLSLLLLSVAACKKNDGTVSISGDVAGLDTLGFRGDSLIAQANRPFGAIDTLKLDLALRDTARPRGTSRDTASESRAGSLGDV